MDVQIGEVASVLRSCLITSKNGCPIDHLNKDYRMLEGRSIPYQKLGFPTLDSFMKVVPGIRMMRRGAELWVEAVPTKESAHISRLVANQHQPKARRRPQRFVRPPPLRHSHPMPLSRNMRGADFGQARNRPANTATQNNRVASSSNNIPLSQMKVTVYPPKPLMQQLVEPPIMSQPNVSPSKPRYLAALTSPSKRLTDKNIQPQQHLDFDKKQRAIAAMPVTVYSPKKTTPGESTRVPIKPQQFIDSLPKASIPPLMSINPLRPMLSMIPTTQTSPMISTPMTPTTPMTPPTPCGSMGLWSSITRPNLAGFGFPTQESLTPPQSPISTWQPPPKSKIADRLKIQPTPMPQFNNSIVKNGNDGIQVTFTNTLGGGNNSLMDPREELKTLTQQLGLPAPVYKDVPVVGRRGNDGTVYGQVVIGTRKFSSYPEEAKSEKEAEIHAAKQALMALKKEVTSKTCLSATADKRLIKQRILAIVDQHNGVFTHKIPAYYEEQHNENLPEDWAKEITKWAEVMMDEGVDKSTILRRQDPIVDKTPGLPAPKGILLTPMGPAKPPPLELPEQHDWFAYVTVVMSTDEIWVRLYGEEYSDKFDVVTDSMNEHYSSVTYPACEAVEVGEYYALLEDKYCYRVRVLDVDETTGEATIFFIDIGDENTVSASQLLPLDKKFCQLPGQAVKVSLAGLEEFADCQETIELVLPRIQKILLDGVFCVEDSSRGVEDDIPVASIVFWDTNGPEEVNVNDMIWKKIHQQLITTVPKLEDEKHITEVHISHVEENGDVFIQMKHEGMQYLVNMLNKVIDTGMSEEDLKRAAIKTVDRTSVYFVKCPESGNWYRANVVDVVTKEPGAPPSLKVYLIDFGRTIYVTRENVLQLEVLSKTLAKYPAQAMKVALHDIEPAMLDEKIIAKLTKIAPPSETLLLKVIKPSYRGSTPSVELYKRNEDNNELIAINVGLALEYERSKSNGDGNNNVKPRKRIERVNSRVHGESDGESSNTLKPPQISDIGEYFNVHVTMAANPSNFTVQPHENAKALEIMMTELQSTCSSYKGPQPTVEAIREGRLFAAHHVDGVWYRVCISNVINEHMVTVYFCDFGDVTVITLDKLQPLPKQFFELPYQAIKARLVGIQPTNIDWSPEDCVRFQEIVVERNFVSIVMESAPDKHSPGDTVLGLKLIDTSSSEDIYIERVLVEEGRAVYTD